MVVCDESEVIRGGLKAFFKNWQIDVVDEASTEAQSWDVIRTVRPDWIVLGFNFRESSGLGLCKKIRADLPKSRILIYTSSYFATRFCKRLRRTGVHAIVLKTSPYAYWSYAMQEKQGGETWLDPHLLELVNKYPDSPLPLNVREAEVLVRLTLPDQEIAEELGLTSADVEMTVKELMRKVGTTSRADTALKAAAFGCAVLPKESERDKVTGKALDELAAEQNALKALGSI